MLSSILSLLLPLLLQVHLTVAAPWYYPRLFSRQSMPVNGQTVFSNNGTLSCYSSANRIDPAHYMTPTDGTAAIAEFCSHAQGVLQPSSLLRFQARRYLPANPAASQTDHFIDVSARWLGGNCAAFDFKAPGGQDVCKARLNNMLDSCDTAVVKSGPPYTKQGGTFQQDCIIWSLAVDNFTQTESNQMAATQL